MIVWEVSMKDGRTFLVMGNPTQKFRDVLTSFEGGDVEVAGVKRIGIITHDISNLEKV